MPQRAHVLRSPETKYVLEREWLTIDERGQEVFAGSSEWEFVAAIGGGNLADMALIPITQI